ncbi:hypothetical protein RCL1_006337 [Eukaryota sp. TZLM3-RCL]
MKPNPLQIAVFAKLISKVGFRSKCTLVVSPTTIDVYHDHNVPFSSQSAPLTPLFSLGRLEYSMTSVSNTDLLQCCSDNSTPLLIKFFTPEKQYWFEVEGFEQRALLLHTLESCKV